MRVDNASGLSIHTEPTADPQRQDSETHDMRSARYQNGIHRQGISGGKDQSQEVKSTRRIRGHPLASRCRDCEVCFVADGIKPI